MTMMKMLQVYRRNR